MKSTDVRHIYNKYYYLSQVDGFSLFNHFDGSIGSLFERYRRNIELLDLQPHHNFLDVGCGRGEICIYHSLQGGKSFGIDFSSDAILLAIQKASELGAKVDFNVSSYGNINYKSNSFDRILASEFIEHISLNEASDFIKYSYRILKPGGKLLLFTHPNVLQRKYGYPILYYWSFIRGYRLPRFQEDVLCENYRYLHLNEYSIRSLKSITRSGGFRKITSGYDMPPPGSRLEKLLLSTPLKHIFSTNLYVIAEK